MDRAQFEGKGEDRPMVTLDHIREAAVRIDGAVEHTSCRRSQTLSEITGAEVWLKFENHQFTASFKERGALNRLLTLQPEQRDGGLIAVSAGNHAQAVAYHASRLGAPATIVMPRDTPNVKVIHTEAFGAEVVLHGSNLAEAADRMRELAVERSLYPVHPYDDEAVVAGQGTVALEMLEEVPGLDTLIVPVGGGGLIAGSVVAARGLRPELAVFGVQSERFPSMRGALEGRHRDCGGDTVAEGIAVEHPGRIPLEIVRDRVEEVILVSETRLEEAVLLLLEVEKTVVEGAGAAGLATLLTHRERFEGRTVGLILSGGNIDLNVLSSIIERGLVRTGRIVRLRVELPDRPGALADVSRILGDSGANIVEVSHRRTFAHVPLKAADVEFVLGLRGREHLNQVRTALVSGGYVVMEDRAFGA
jgi:threonine dehydratase